MTFATPPVFDPTLVTDLGQIVHNRDEDAIEAAPPGSSVPYAFTGLPPLGWNHGKPDTSRQIGWTLTRRGALVNQHAFAINPQGIVRSDTPRNQMFATQGGFYVDDFGPGPTTIQLTQLIAHGRATAGGGGGLQRATMREDVLRFYDLIYIPWSKAPATLTVQFYDSHLWNQPTSKTGEPVYFPSNGVQLTRHVSLHNVWQLQVTMITTRAPTTAQAATGPVPGRPKVRVYIVRHGDTLKKIATRLAGKNATHKRVLQIEQTIVALTKSYGADDITKARTVNTFSTRTEGQQGQVHVTRMHVAPGEKIVLPAG